MDDKTATTLGRNVLAKHEPEFADAIRAGGWDDSGQMRVVKSAIEIGHTWGIDEPRLGDIGEAVLALKAGKRVMRRGWNGQGMWLYYVPPAAYDSQTPIARDHFGPRVAYQGYVAMKTADGTVVPWLASQTDLLATDWVVMIS